MPTSISIATPACRSCSIAFTSSAEDIPVVICRGEVVLRNPEQPRDRRLPRLQRRDRSDARPRLVDRRRRAGGARGRGLRRVRRARRAGGRSERAGRPGRVELADRELSRVPDRHLRAGARGPRLHPGAEVRRADADRQGRHAADLRPQAVRDRDRRRSDACRRAPSSSPPAPSTARLRFPNLERFEGAGVYYGATFIEAQLCGGEEVIVVGGGNSAGQAAVFLAQTARHVHMLVRSGGLADTCRATSSGASRTTRRSRC